MWRKTHLLCPSPVSVCQPNTQRKNWVQSELISKVNMCKRLFRNLSLQFVSDVCWMLLCDSCQQLSRGIARCLKIPFFDRGTSQKRMEWNWTERSLKGELSPCLQGSRKCKIKIQTESWFSLRRKEELLVFCCLFFGCVFSLVYFFFSVCFMCFVLEGFFCSMREIGGNVST